MWKIVDELAKPGSPGGLASSSTVSLSSTPWSIVTQCKCGCNKEVNGYFSGSNKVFRISHPPIFRMTAGKGVLNDLNGVLPK